MDSFAEKLETFRMGDWVSFHTRWGRTTGMLEYFISGHRAVITVGRLHGGPKKYIRHLYKLKKVTL